MPKYGRGMKVEIVDAIKKGKLKQPINTRDVEQFMNNNGWYPRKNFLNVFLANHSNPGHSKTYEKIFKSIGNGKYVLLEEIKD
ncbi:hypothetical protein BKP45_04895 [Anaerobacillus alkalidiazotrophicus]|uniref:Uncharacterized protein n=1 Tax=Anaerobacillus alkalidiazotrophicus TaxID=472963 RepID=A0A1S2MDS9_9BACI|nr:hypothetical protein [Anaerobacillus alkalidiazotrophicus]OIJ22017.1 hypothetical protein BKP45_04895 [Anaerobacillus alkalidiazotrophicus]